MVNMNVKQIADLWVAGVKNRSLAYRSNHILYLMGCDFQYMNADILFKNTEKLIKYVNEHSAEYGVHVKYSTPSLYLKEVHKANLTWSVKSDDFFPYPDCAHCYWSGYFTSRPALKGYVRQMTALYSTVTKAYSLAVKDKKQSRLDQIDVLAQANGVAQHHDAVAGTEKQAVAFDYALRLSVGESSAIDVMAHVLNDYLVGPGPYSYCPLLNMSVCAPLNATADGVVPVVMFNSLAWQRNDVVRLPVAVAQLSVVAPNGSTIVSQIVPNSDTGDFTIVFAVSIPPMGYATYLLVPATYGDDGVAHKSKTVPDQSISNEFYTLTFSNGLLSSIYSVAAGQELQLTQDYFWYNASAGYTNDLSHQPSGAYIFRPNVSTPYGFAAPSIQITTGPVFSEVVQVWNSWVQQTIRLYSGIDVIEVESNIGPVPINDNLGKEVIVRYNTSLNSELFYYTDSEGQEMQERLYNHRWSYNATIAEPVAGNYYPVNTASYIQDLAAGLRLTIVTDRSRGGASLANGVVENMLHRRLLYDDFRGVGEPLNETNGIRTLHHLHFAEIEQSSRLQRTDALLLNNPIQFFFASPQKSAQSWLSSHKPIWSPLSAPLPLNAHVLTLKPLSSGNKAQMLLSLNHPYAIGEDSILSQNVTVDLATMFEQVTIDSIEEMSLTGNQPLKDIHRLQWNTVNGPTQTPHEPLDPTAGLSVTLSAMQIRTFKITFK
jgi:lysosomal alpha-mannosidase